MYKCFNVYKLGSEKAKKYLELALYSREPYYDLDDEEQTNVDFMADDSYSSLLSALSCVVSYNCLEEGLLKTKTYLKECYKNDKIASRPYDIMPYTEEDRQALLSRSVKYGIKYMEQMEVFWMIMVEMFGGCGTSPRTGWIDKDMIPVAIMFINKLIRA